ncbi:MAG: DNA polymerase I, partial [Nitrospirae bacterium]|nr:DNA polymerase I [Nitrospirota bacterium]
SKEMTQREALYPQYKAQRKVPPKELTCQIDPIIEIVKALGIPTFAVPGYEADDIIAKLAIDASNNGADVFIVTSDKDLLQLVSTKIKIFDPVKNIVQDREYVINRFSLPPERVIEYLALTGDSADNIPGVKGIGEKTAKTLLSKGTSLDDLMNNPQNIDSPRFRTMITDNIENIKLSYQLLTLKTDMELNLKIPHFNDITPDLTKVKELFMGFELNSLLKNLPKSSAPSVGATLVTAQEDATIEVIELTKADEFNFGDDGISEIFININNIVFAFSLEPNRGFYFTKHELIEPFLNLLKSAKKISGHDFKSMVNINSVGASNDLLWGSVPLLGNVIDTMLVSYLLDPNKRDYSFKNMVTEYLGHIGQDNSETTLPFEDNLKTHGQDAALGLRLLQLLSSKIDAVIDIYNNIEYPLLWVLSDMEHNGVKIDSNRLIELSNEMGKQMDAVSNRIYFHAGCEFNINSPKELSKILFESLELPTNKKIKTGYSTDTTVLEFLSEIHPIAVELLEFRRLTKLKNTYIDPLPNHINKTSGRLHTTFNQTATATGRLSSTNPNLQNIPIKGEGGEMMRKVFIAPDGHLLISADYSQIELRILAHLSGDVTMIDAFKAGYDIHQSTACEIFDCSEKFITPDMRRVAKTVNFGVIYGQTPYGLAKTLHISHKEAKDYIERYFKKYAGVKAFIEQTIKEATILGYTKTMMGRIRPIPELKSSNKTIIEHGQRQAVNSPIQGTAADIIKIAMINIHKEISKMGLKTKMILQIHDELLLEAPLDELDIALTITQKLMEGACILSVPLKVDIGSGNNWAVAH